MKTRIIATIALSIALSLTARAQVPGIINYQGRITTGGTNFTGAGQFKFSLVNSPPGTTTYWSNGASAVSIGVTNGLYSVLLGDTSIPNMTFAIPASVFTNSDVRLHVLFDGGSGLQPLAPDQRIGAAGYALNAAMAASVSPSSDVTGQRLNIGSGNILSGAFASIAGGEKNTASGKDASIAGGSNNVASGDFSALLGGHDNTASGGSAMVGGGAFNAASGLTSVVGGGFQNSATNGNATVAGGLDNTAYGFGAAIGGGVQNTASGIGATVAGGGTDATGPAGKGNTASGNASTIGGGLGNHAYGYASFIGGGQNNAAIVTAYSSTIAGGMSNVAYAAYDFVGGGLSNQAGDAIFTIPRDGAYAVVPGGRDNVASADYSFAAGRRAKAQDIGAFVWADSTDADFSSTAPDQFLIRASGGVGIGTASPEWPLDVQASYAVARFVTTDNGSGGVIELKNNSSSPSLLGAINFNDAAGTYPGQIAYTADNNMTFGVGGVERMRVKNDGTVSVCVLQILGGCDVAEPFDMSTKNIPKGAIVVIDEEKPGQLKLSERAYDTRVAGIVSGANGIKPGLSLRQQGAFEDGQNVALSGRVYALADASNGPIKPGDLLTTSDTPGHCMRVTNHGKAQGAIIGKAMTGLENGKGMVLVLVSLQ